MAAPTASRYTLGGHIARSAFVTPAARARLARVLGYRSEVAADALDHFDADLGAHRTAARGERA